MACAQDQDNDNDLIRITHYINPHNFWFKHDSAYLYNAEEQKFLLELNEYCESTYTRGKIAESYIPHRQGELVAVFYFQQARWIRAEVDEIQQELGGQIHCNLWAIDEGIPVRTNCRYIKPLPERFAGMSTNVRHGGLEGILPAESAYDYLQGCSVTKIIQVWSQGVARVFESCIEEAVSIKFYNLHRHQVTGIDMYFGTMTITSHQNVTNNATDLLKKAGGKMVMLVDNAEFYDKLPYLKTLHMQRFEDNEQRENTKYHTNTFRPEYSRSAVRSTGKIRSGNTDIIEQAREKFFEWDKRNTASSIVTTHRSHQDYDEIPQSVVSHGPSQHRKPTDEHELVYTELINESLSDDEGDLPKSNIRNSAPMSQLTGNSSSNKGAIQGNTSIKQANKDFHNNNCVKTSDVMSALQKIKLRRQTPNQRTSSDKQSAVGSHRSSVGATSTLNIVPAGFCLGNVEFTDGSVVLGEKNTAPDKRRFTKEIPDRNSAVGARNWGTTNSKTVINKAKYNNYGEERVSTSFGKKINRETVMKPTEPSDDDEEQW
ncbi:putative ATP-dependent RNA helicase SoYb [Toxorhynchites rutilus septentrionalis]|uniref:putative ATP-dependent RNA helicase SoYb n=1 Tax=Toxorhynchites rutilus septentrionalis TaxID=329112 RepID=UPI002479AFD9|nr:putative ATP-dependent RNA helicase SoYb [Toxorhynchites rutilus septentrionalis]